MRTVALCEIEAYACANLVAKMEAGLMDPAPIWTDLKTFPWDSFRGRVDILTGGYPCQPFSTAGKRAGTDDPRHLWPFIADSIQVVRPKLCFFENVEGHISLGLQEVIADLEELGYETAWGIFSAAEVGAPHQRKRVFIMAHRNGERGLLSDWGRLTAEQVSVSNGTARRDVWPSRPEELVNSEHDGHIASEIARRNSTSVDARWQNEPQEHRQFTGRCGSVWPSRPGQPQYAWEPPRVVGNAKSREDNGRESGDMGCTTSEGGCGNDAADCAGEGVGNTTDTGLERRQQSTATRTTTDSASSASGCGQIESALGLCADESSGFLGEGLTLNPHVDNVDSYESLSEKARARQILFEVWSKANTQEVQWTTRGLQCFLAEEILWTGMQLAAFTQRICYFVWCVQTGHPIQGWGLSGMWVYESCGSSSQGQKPIEQFKRELGYAMCQLSYEIALERGQEAVEGAAILRGLREASEGAWALSDALPEMEEVWRSTLDQKVWENGCYVEAASQGNRTDELRLLGNGVVPATAALAFTTLLDEIQSSVHQ